MLGLGNNVATLAANTGGTIFYNDSDGLTVGTVSENASPATMMIPGITTTTNNDDVKLVVGEHLMITEAIKLGSGNLFLDVAGNVTQTTTGTITAAGLALMVDGNTMLGLGNNVATLAANTGGTIFYNDSDGLTVGTVSENASPATMMIPGITTTNNDDVKLIVGDTATEHLMITEAIKLGSGNLFLDVAGNVTQTTTGTITAAGLALMVDGNTMLGLGNNVATLAANTGGTIFYNDSDGLTVGTVSENASPATMMIPGITTTNNDDVKLIVGDTGH